MYRKASEPAWKTAIANARARGYARKDDVMLIVEHFPHFLMALSTVMDIDLGQVMDRIYEGDVDADLLQRAVDRLICFI